MNPKISDILQGIKSWYKKIYMTVRKDDFSKKVIQKSCERAAYICSNPECHRLTLTPEIYSNSETIYVGTVAHITAAQKGGARYDKTITSEQRKSIDNAIFLCGYCAIKIDKNEGKDYPAKTLREWKMIHEVWLRNKQKDNKYIRQEYNRISPYFINFSDFIPDERASGHIIVPSDNDSVVSRSINVKGRMDKIIESSEYWIAVSPQGSLGYWWVQKQCELVKDDFFVTENIVLGREFPDGLEDIGRKFKIGLFEVTSEAREVFKDLKSKDQGVQRPSGAYLLWEISVIRVA